MRAAAIPSGSAPWRSSRPDSSPGSVIRLGEVHLQTTVDADLYSQWRSSHTLGAMEFVYPAFGRIVIDEESYDHDVIVDGGEVARRDKGPSRPH